MKQANNEPFIVSLILVKNGILSVKTWNERSVN
jgi:hypothetical protein